MLTMINRSILLVMFMSSFGSLAFGEEWRTFTNREGRSIEARMVMMGDGEAWVVLKSTGKQIPLKLEVLSDEDQEFLRNWSPESASESGGDGDGEGDGGGDVGGDVGEASKRLYPKTREEIRAAVREIGRRDPANGVDRKQQEAINELNIYRYLCGVPHEVESTPELVAKCVQAAKACDEHGSLSHSLGRFTNKCNLSGGPDIVGSVRSYINDGGANNREARGHRRWCLNPPMETAAFGSSGKFSAMWCMDSGGKKLRDSWAYPGKGFFPKDRLHGNAWSLYLTESAPPRGKLTVEVFKLSRRPERALSISGEIDGRPLPVAYVSVAYNAVNFEPESGTVGRGIYWVRVRGGGVREGYLVELF